MDLTQGLRCKHGCCSHMKSHGLHLEASGSVALHASAANTSSSALAAAAADVAMVLSAAGWCVQRKMMCWACSRRVFAAAAEFQQNNNAATLVMQTPEMTKTARKPQQAAKISSSSAKPIGLHNTKCAKHTVSLHRTMRVRVCDRGEMSKSEPTTPPPCCLGHLCLLCTFTHPFHFYTQETGSLLVLTCSASHC